MNSILKKSALLSICHLYAQICNLGEKKNSLISIFSLFVAPILLHRLDKRTTNALKIFFSVLSSVGSLCPSGQLRLESGSVAEHFVVSPAAQKTLEILWVVFPHGEVLKCSIISSLGGRDVVQPTRTSMKSKSIMKNMFIFMTQQAMLL